MKQVQFSQFVDPARLLAYLLSRLVAQHSVPGAAGDILNAERCWPSRYY
jgi:hypothetical protein